MSTFDSTKLPLPDVLRAITEGSIQLPDFQRGWVWDDEHVSSLLVSIARSFPVGAVMLLDTGGEVRFQVRPIENVSFDGAIPEPERLILDGQQRLTSLTQVLALDRPVKTFDDKGKAIDRHYYIDITKALEADQLDEAFISVPADRKLKVNFNRDVVLDLSTPERECRAFHFPCNQILNSDDWEESLNEHAPERFQEYMRFRKQVLNAFRSYQLPAITLGKATSKEAVCLVFEKVNTGGVPLSVFELVTAAFAADGFNLRDDWYGSEERGVEGRHERLTREPVLGTIAAADFLQAISILHTHEQRQASLAAGKTGKAVAPVSAKRAAVLSLSLAEYERWADQVESGFILTARFLRKQCLFDTRNIPYRTQLVPLAAVLSSVQERWLEPRVYARLSRWFWCGVLGELYGGAVETRIANDFDELARWLTSDLDDADYAAQVGLPRTIAEASFQESRLDRLRSRLSAAYKGLNVLVLREGAQDFFWKASIHELEKEATSLDIHHIFPKAWCQQQGLKPAVFDSIVNKTPISYKANRMIGGKAPSTYLAALQKHTQVGLDDAGMNAMLATHRIDAEAMRTDDFQTFYARRKQALLDVIEQAMGKTVQRDQSGGPTERSEPK